MAMLFSHFTHTYREPSCDIVKMGIIFSFHHTIYEYNRLFTIFRLYATSSTTSVVATTCSTLYTESVYIRKVKCYFAFFYIPEPQISSFV